MRNSHAQVRRLLVCLLFASAAWAGRIFPALPGEAVVPGQYIVHYQTGVTLNLNGNPIPGAQVQAIGNSQGLYLVQVPAGTDAGYLDQFVKDPTVDYAEPNRIRHTTIAAPNDASLSSQWNLVKIQAQQAWQYIPNVFLTSATAGTGRIKIAVIDTGADCTHPDFVNAGGSSSDVAAGGQLLYSASSALVTTTHTPAACAWQDDYGHGTHVSGTVAAATNNSIGVAALGYALELIEYKVLDHTGNGTDATVASAITMAADAGANVISMSLGGIGYSQTVQNAVTYAWQRNCLVIAAAGNDNANEIFFPGDANYAMAVAASDEGDQKASFSNFGPAVGIAAPGSNIFSTLPTYANNFAMNYGNLSGTSMAAPHVSALAGLIEMATPNLAPLAVAQRIQQSADSSIANGGRDDNFGYGRINAWRALAPGNLRSATEGAIRGQVVDGNGLPLSGVTVSANSQSVSSDASTGLFRLPDFPPGTYTVTATGSSTVTQKVAVVAGADTVITIQIGVPLGEFHGVVSDGGTPLAGAVVQAVSGGLTKVAAVTDSTGAYSLVASPGTYDLRASTIAGITATATSQTVAANGSTAANISMARLGSIAGTVLDSSQAPIANAAISIAAGSYTAGALTNASGQYSTIGLPAGTYSVSAAVSGNPTTINGIAVTNDHVAVVNFPLTSVIVATSIAGLTFDVDGIDYTAAQTFTWQVGSNHTIAVSATQNGGTGTRFVWSGWSDGGAVSHSIVASASTASYVASFGAQYLLTLAASPAAGGAIAPNPTSTDGYYANGTSVQITATANSGYQFSAFSGDLAGSSPQSVVMNAPRSVTAAFKPQITVQTNPSALSVTVDGVTSSAPATVFWTPASSGHTLATTSPQSGGAGTQYVWSSWSDGGSLSHSVPSAPSTPTTYTANFTTQYQLTINVNPAGAGSTTGAGFAPAGSAPITATPNSGFVFVNWTGGTFANANSASTTVTLSGPATITANFAPQVTIASSAAGRSFSVTGAGCQAGASYTAPQVLNWTPGSSCVVTFVATQAGATGTQYAFNSWADNANTNASRTFVAGSAGATYTANFDTQYQLTVAANPAGSGTVTGAGFHTAGSVPITATANAGFVFSNWSGGSFANASSASTTVTLNAPITVTANFGTSVTIASSPAGRSFSVTGTGCQPGASYITPQALTWTPGSSCVVSFTTPQPGAAGIQYAFNSWTDSSSTNPSRTFTVPAAAATYTANFDTQYQLTVAANPAGAGSVTGAGFHTAGSIAITATGNSGFVFSGWTGGTFGNASSASTTVTLSAPTTITANFATSVTIASAAAGRTFSVTGAGCQPGSYTAPQPLSWTPGSSCVVAFSTPQPGAAGVQYAFSSWADNSSGNPSRTFSVPASATTYTANFDTQYQLTVNASPVGGGAVTGAGFHTTGAVPITATPSAGFVFSNWTGATFGAAGSPSTTVTLSAPTTITANFVAPTTVNIASSPAGRSFSVTGTGCQPGSYTAPQPLSWTSGSTCVVTYATPQAGAAGVQYVFNSWADNSSNNPSRAFVVPATTMTYTANFDTQYQLTINASPAGSGAVTGAGFHAPGAVSISATANAGFAFTNWTGATFGNAGSASTTVALSAPTTITANFLSPASVTIASNPGGRTFSVTGTGCQPGSYATPQPLTWTAGASCTVAFSTPQAGGTGTQYSFNSWADNASTNPTRTFAVPATPTTYTANFDTQYQLILAASPAGAGALTGAGFHTPGSVPIAAAANSGFVFSNWTGAAFGNAGSASTTVTLNAPLTVTANFAIAVTVASAPAGRTFTVTGAGCQPGSYTATQTLGWTPGSSCVVTFSTPQSPYVFNSWADNGSTNPSRTFTVPAAAATYTANFDTQFQLTIATNPAGAGSVTGAGLHTAGAIPITATPNAGFVFSNWTGGTFANANSASTTVTLNAPTAITANFTSPSAITIASSPAGRTFTVTGAGCQPGSYTAPQPLTWTAGSSCVVTFSTPQSPYVFNSWADNGSTNPSRTFTAGAATTYTANFDTQYQLTIATNPPGAGTVTGAGLYVPGAIPIAAAANAGFVFSNWSGGTFANPNSTSTTVTLTSATAITANFLSPSSVTIASSPAGRTFSVAGAGCQPGSYTAPQPLTWIPGSSCVVTFSTPQSPYVFNSWADNGSTGPSRTFTAGSAATYTANFDTQYQLTIASNPAGAGTVTGAGLYTPGAVPIVAAPNPGFVFSNWTGGTFANANSPSTTVTVSAAASITANFTTVTPSTVSIDHTHLYFGASNGLISSPQTVQVTTGAAVNWIASSNQSNITVSPGTGTGTGTFQVIAAAGPSGIVTVSAPGAPSQQVQVSITNVTTAPPFGSFDTPASGATGIAGAIAVTGWALDNVEVSKVDIWREPVGAEPVQPNGLVLVGNAVFVPDTRPDVEAAYATTPQNYRAGWGYLFLTNFLPNSDGSSGTGNGTYKLHAIAHNKAGNLIDLGTHTLTVDNSHAARPFGTIDTPDQGAVVSGNSFVNFGWALTQNPHTIPRDGSTITVTVDGVALGHPTYNQFRSDIAAAFPGLANSNGAVGYFFIDTTKLANGLHTIGWLAYDDAGHGDGLGSRFFTVENNTVATAAAEPKLSLPAATGVLATLGFDRSRSAKTLQPDAAGVYQIRMNELGRVELQLGAVHGYLNVNGSRRPLPVGSSLRDGIFYWQPPPGFIGEYRLQFERPEGTQLRVQVTIGQNPIKIPTH